MTRSPDLTTAELRVMKALWTVEHGTVAEVHSAFMTRSSAVVRSGERVMGLVTTGFVSLLQP